MDYNRNNNPYTPPNHPYDSNGQHQFVRNPGQTMAMISLILGIASIVTLFSIYLPIILGSIAIVLAILSKGYGKKMLTTAKVGVGTAIGGMTLIVAIFGAIISLFLSMTGDELVEFGRQIDQQFEQQTGMDIEKLTGTSYEEIMKSYAEMME
ncbi:MAG: hypothetical protein K2H52_07035 [Lachnospiraceae bacterium]|nr:hypothetical protein [Lachnospiraceae bacterium]MDE6184741.1 hypothetical protein [Lachnospiraceae bacterium]